MLRLPPKQRIDWSRRYLTQTFIPVPEPKELSFIRKLEGIRSVSERDLHEERQCARCILGGKYDEKPHHFAVSDSKFFSAYGLELVVSLSVKDNGLDKHDICLFAVSDLPEVAVLRMIKSSQ
ncbi:hypothetical protein ACMFMG_002396 [Clarireedia jacksonii]